MNKKAVFRRKWSFEKGRNSSAVILSALMTSAVLAVLIGFFNYEYHFRGNKEQKGIMVRIDPESNWRLFELLDLCDPARTFGITGGSFGELDRNNSGGLYSEKMNDIILLSEPPEIVMETETSNAGKTAFQTIPVPVSSSFTPFLPVDRPGDKRSLATRVTAPDGEVIFIPALVRVKGAHRTSTTIKIAGAEYLRQAQTIISCGNREVDQQAAVILKNSDLAPGIYQINWYNEAESK